MTGFCWMFLFSLVPQIYGFVSIWIPHWQIINHWNSTLCPEGILIQGKPSVFSIHRDVEAPGFLESPWYWWSVWWRESLPATNKVFLPKFQTTALCGFSHWIFHGFSKPQRRKPPQKNCGECHRIKFDLEFGTNITILAYNLSQFFFAQNLQPDPFLLAKPWLPGSSKQPPKSSGPTWHITTSPPRAVRGCVHWRKGEGETVDGVTVDDDDDDDDDSNNADSDNIVLLIILLNIIENHWIYIYTIY